MGDDQHLLTRMSVCDVLQGCAHAGCEVDQALTLLREFERRFALLETVIELWVLTFGLSVGQALEKAVMTFAQTFVIKCIQSLSAHHRSGSLSRTLQVAAVHGREALPETLEAVGDRLGLGETNIVEWDVDMTLESALCVPGGLAVAHEADRAALCGDCCLCCIHRFWRSAARGSGLLWNNSDLPSYRGAVWRACGR